MDMNFFDKDELNDLLKEMEESHENDDEQEDAEMSASERRYMEIIKKHKS